MHARDAHTVTPQDLANFRTEAEAGILEELVIWGQRFKTMKPVLRKPGMNVMTSKYVPKWKLLECPKSKKMTWILRMRLTLRGFQDWFAHLHETYAGTASR